MNAFSIDIKDTKLDTRSNIKDQIKESVIVR